MNSLRVSVLLRIYCLRRIRYGSLTLMPDKGSTPQSHCPKVTYNGTHHFSEKTLA